MFYSFPLIVLSRIMAKLTFQPVPSQTDLQSRIPAGRQAVTAKPFAPPVPAFGPGSLEHVRKQAEELELQVEPGTDRSSERSSGVNPLSKGSYAGAESYF
jgi:hypothetical protein